ncbi:hypothetical protein J2S00_001648 [Caldalkalibacillus uzonensis]|uniref:DNA alkylation repair protein n=1 Tax=Caldalkalibacillus uzonensis TaxID=353224 RepID=A0ABU0CRT7_9BACI|nr:DNA alkylation repair protein [Caldalkalibacillus uzonensis]MDQ0338862.1 hypothetical protein [Caldalkalibacillus uzonensis]
MPFYRCPSCQARSRFNVIEQVVTPIKVDLETGQAHELNELDPFHLPYQGPDKRIQCASCGLIEDELQFIKRAVANIK